MKGSIVTNGSEVLGVALGPVSNGITLVQPVKLVRDGEPVEMRDDGLKLGSAIAVIEDDAPGDFFRRGH